jgi:hypothetical protein
MLNRQADPIEFEALRPRILALLELYRVAQTDEARQALMGLFEDAFLATAWHAARDLLENGWVPQTLSTTPARRGGLKVVDNSDAA